MATGTLTGTTIASTYKSILKLGTNTAGDGAAVNTEIHATTLKVIEDGHGSNTSIQLAQNRVEIVPVANHANAFEVSQADGTQILNINSTTPAASLTGTFTQDAGAVVFNEAGADYDFRVESDNATYALFVQGSDGAVGIGTSSPDLRLEQKLDIATSDDYGGMSISTWSTNNTDMPILDFKKSGHATIGTHVAVEDDELLGIIVFRGSDGVEFLDAAYILGSADGAVTGGGTNDMPGRLTFHTTPDGGSGCEERMRIDHAGDVTFTGDLKMADGKGIDFSAMTTPADATGMAAEILDDYEEGTWTPVLSDADADNATPASGEAVGTYTKIGDFVSVRWYYTCSSLGDVNNGVRFTGLPFTAKNVSFDKGVFVAAVAGNLGISFGQNIGGFCQPNQSFLYLETWDAGTGSTEMAESEFSDDGSITMFGNYHTA